MFRVALQVGLKDLIRIDTPVKKYHHWPFLFFYCWVIFLPYSVREWKPYRTGRVEAETGKHTIENEGWIYSGINLSIMQKIWQQRVSFHEQNSTKFCSETIFLPKQTQCLVTNGRTQQYCPEIEKEETQDKFESKKWETRPTDRRPHSVLEKQNSNHPRKKQNMHSDRTFQQKIQFPSHLLTAKLALT